MRRNLTPAFAFALALACHPAVADTTTVAELRRDSFATVAGTVDRITDEDEFVLADGTGHVRVYVGPTTVPVRPGETVTVSGHVDDGLRLEIYAREIVRADGTILVFDHRY
jgi:uncharacterized protein YdeI (BOF family)